MIDSLWTYSQTTGLLTSPSGAFWQAYSGHGEGKNNPALEHIHDVGPIPKGLYRAGELEDRPSTIGRDVRALIPEPGTETFGRSGFFLHGDSKEHPGAASHGCICAEHFARVTVKTGDLVKVTE